MLNAFFLRVTKVISSCLRKQNRKLPWKFNISKATVSSSDLWEWIANIQAKTSIQSAVSVLERFHKAPCGPFIWSKPKNITIHFKASSSPIYFVDNYKTANSKSTHSLSAASGSVWLLNLKWNYPQAPGLNPIPVQHSVLCCRDAAGILGPGSVRWVFEQHFSKAFNTETKAQEAAGYLLLPGVQVKGKDWQFFYTIVQDSVSL